MINYAVFKKGQNINSYIASIDEFDIQIIDNQEVKIKKDINNCIMPDEVAYEIQEVGKYQLINNEIFQITKEHFNAIQRKTNEMSLFFQGAARHMQIADGAIQNIIVDQNFANNLNSAIKQAKELGFYEHRLRDINNNPIIADGKVVKILITLESLEIISNKIEIRRGYCACAEVYHKIMISNLLSEEEVEAYNFMTDDSGNPYQEPEIIKLDELGNIV